MCFLYLVYRRWCWRMWFRCLHVGKNDLFDMRAYQFGILLSCVLWMIWRERNSKMFEGFEFPRHVIKKLYLRSLSDWMCTLGGVLSTFFFFFFVGFIKIYFLLVSPHLVGFELIISPPIYSCGNMSYHLSQSYLKEFLDCNI